MRTALRAAAAVAALGAMGVSGAALPLRPGGATGAAPVRPASAPGSRGAPVPPSASATSTAGAASVPQPQGRLRDLNARVIKLAQAGQYASCRPLLEEILTLDPSDGVAWYNLACVHARLDEPAKAIQCLQRAVENDYADFRHLEHDEDLASLRPLAEYKDLLARKEQIQRARAERIRDALRQRLGGDYIVEIDHADKLVFATNVDRATLEELKTRLTACARCLWRDLLDNRFEQYVTVVIPSLPASAAMVPPGSGGYYDHGRRTLVAAQVGMVLVHEFVHALHSADQEARGQVHPVWIQEGLATLFESSRIEGDGMVPQPNLRLNLLKSLIARKQDIPFREFFRYDQGEFMKRAVVCYPQGRYIMMYLFEKGLLKKWYDAYTSSYQTDATGTAAMEKVFGEDLSAVQRDWLAWVQAKTPPAVALPARHAYIGVRTMGQTDGLRVLEVVPGSGAERAGLKVGDVIIHLDGARVVEPGELVQMIDRHNVGDGVQVRFRRDGQYRTVTVVLQEMPEGLSLRMPPTAPSTRPASSPAGRPARRPPRTLPTSAPASRKAA